MSFQGPDAKKEEFRKYLERAGVVDTLTKALVGLYEAPDCPVNAMAFVKEFIGATGDSGGGDIESLRRENEALREKNADLTAEVERLRAQLA